jgi:hopanoid biosynthesis associated protein HpnK
VNPLPALTACAANIGSRTRSLIVTADDFGLAMPVNEAIERAHKEGILAAASLMTGGPAFADAAARARKLPHLSVGLHVTLLDGRPVLPPEQVPGLVGSDGRFFSDPFRFGLALYFLPALRRQADAEIDAQFARFGETGLAMDHVNGHKHFHLHPVVLQAVIRNAARFGQPPLRLPFEPFGASFKAARDRPLGRAASALFYFVQTRHVRRAVRGAGLASNDFLFGLNDSGAMTEARVLALIDNLPDGVSELYFHPAARRWEGPDNLPPDYMPDVELATLLSPAVKNKLKAKGLQPLSSLAALDSTARRSD